MTKHQQIGLVALRLSMGWLFFYAGITKILDPSWSAAGYIQNAKTFTALYHVFLHPTVLPIINVLNEWGLLALGVSLLAGGFVRYSANAGIVLMGLYYFAKGPFPFPDTHSFIVDEHIVYIVALAMLFLMNAGNYWGFDDWWSKRQEMTKKS